MNQPPPAPRSATTDPSAMLQRVHDLIGLLPLIAIGRLEQAEILRREQTRLGLAAAGVGGRGRSGQAEAGRRADGRSATRGKRLDRDRLVPPHLSSPVLHLPDLPARSVSPDDSASRHGLDREDLVELLGVEQAAFEHELADRACRSSPTSFAISAVAA